MVDCLSWVHVSGVGGGSRQLLDGEGWRDQGRVMRDEG